MESAKKRLLNLEAYNKLEEANNMRYEYHNGEVFAMAGDDPRHGLIASNLSRILGNLLFSSDCIVFNSDVKFHDSTYKKSLYPDVSVVCGKAIRSEEDKRALTNPLLIVEVLSESTLAYDKGDKFRYYSEFLSLREYVLVEQDSWTAETRFRKSHKDLWQLEWASGKEANLHLKSLDITVALKDIYYRTEGL